MANNKNTKTANFFDKLNNDEQESEDEADQDFESDDEESSSSSSSKEIDSSELIEEENFFKESLKIKETSEKPEDKTNNEESENQGTAEEEGREFISLHESAEIGKKKKNIWPEATKKLETNKAEGVGPVRRQNAEPELGLHLEESKDNNQIILVYEDEDHVMGTLREFEEVHENVIFWFKKILGYKDDEIKTILQNGKVFKYYELEARFKRNCFVFYVQLSLPREEDQEKLLNEDYIRRSGMILHFTTDRNFRWHHVREYKMGNELKEPYVAPPLPPCITKSSNYHVVSTAQQPAKKTLPKPWTTEEDEAEDSAQKKKSDTIIADGQQENQGKKTKNKQNEDEKKSESDDSDKDCEEEEEEDDDDDDDNDDDDEKNDTEFDDDDDDEYLKSEEEGHSPITLNDQNRENENEFNNEQHSSTLITNGIGRAHIETRQRVLRTDRNDFIKRFPVLQKEYEIRGLEIENLRLRLNNEKIKNEEMELLVEELQNDLEKSNEEKENILRQNAEIRRAILPLKRFMNID